MVSHAPSDEAPELSSHPKVAGLPYDDEVNFHDSSFFQKHDLASLPSPNMVREVASRSKDPRTIRRTRPPPVYFPNLGLCVKYGTETTIAEGQCLLFVRSKLFPYVPVPEVYRWCKDDGQVFIYMELIDGVTLERSWEGMDEEDRLAVCEQLRPMIDAWRGLGCDSGSALISKLDACTHSWRHSFLSEYINRQSSSTYQTLRKAFLTTFQATSVNNRYSTSSSKAAAPQPQDRFQASLHSTTGSLPPTGRANTIETGHHIRTDPSSQTTCRLPSRTPICTPAISLYRQNPALGWLLL
jgi:hypothetical protein